MTFDARVLLDRGDLEARVTALAEQITADHPDGVVLIGVLKGAMVFTADLARTITGTPVVIDFLAISRYAPDSGRVRILKDIDVEVAGRDVVVVEDLVDTGLTLAYLLGHLRDRGAGSVDVCTLFDRPERRIVPTDVRYVGEEVPGDAFMVGYGLHVGERYRNLPFVLQVDRGALREDPAACLEWYEVPDPPRGARRPHECTDSGAHSDAHGAGAPGEEPANPDAMVADELERRRP